MLLSSCIREDALHHATAHKPRTGFANLSPVEARRLGPAAAQAVETFSTPKPPAESTLALLPALTPGAKPLVFDKLPQLARRIHAERGGDTLRLQPDRLSWRGQARDVVAIYAENQTSSRVRFLGWAWIDGRDWRALEAALAAIQPAAGVFQEAA